MAQQSERDKLIQAQRDYDERKRRGTRDIAQTQGQFDTTSLAALARSLKPLQSTRVSPVGSLIPETQGLNLNVGPSPMMMQSQGMMQPIPEDAPVELASNIPSTSDFWNLYRQLQGSQNY